MREIQMRLGVDDIMNAVATLNAIREKLESGTIAEELAERGASAAESAYGFPVSVETNENEATIRATHEGLGFIEFGAGMTTDETNPYAGAVPYPVYRGSYSDANEGMYAKTGYQYWLFGGNVFDRVTPRGGMLAAGQTIRDDMEEVVREAIMP